MRITRIFQVAVIAALASATALACGSSSSGDDTIDPTHVDASAGDALGPSNLGDEGGVEIEASNDIDGALPDGALPCKTRITYGDTWIKPMTHPASFDDANGVVTWDGKCENDPTNSFAQLSNGFKPYFKGHDACVLALDQSGACPTAAPACKTRVSYGSAWLAPSNHPNTYDDITGRVFPDGVCHDNANQSYEKLSNGFQPTFSGTGACGLSIEYEQCGGLYQNPVIPVDCPDPGVLFDSGTYYLSCTSGNAADAFPIYTSTDLANWTVVGHIFPSASKPTWAKSDFWAPEIHHVGTHYVAYFSARGADGMLAIGAASAPTPKGPFVALAAPLVHDANIGLIDASEITVAGTPYVLWKEDGNAVNKPTPIHAQPMATTGLALTGSPSTLITNDQAWEGPLVEAPFMVEHGGTYYLFYSGNGYATANYAIGVATAASPTGPFTKASAPILVTGGDFAGPGHCSVVDTPQGDTAIVYHAWKSGSIGASPGRLVLVDQLRWDNPVPAVPFAPSSSTRPLW